ncbi:iron chelate uptake ABC transporter family permease subunit [Jiangella alkaliphila]|uniref:FecCD transport family protein n=1 Tax=Jiangella alkaliphila TaxID=419479 RepID=A0A1H2L6Y3_9ACTN|nr:iron chelate uptake ABC transporter family permease subunit [Jiangella alkaliphila]SDU76753.1 FecCD transport family protein [Jiangella alkaliphila]
MREPMRSSPPASPGRRITRTAAVKAAMFALLVLGVLLDQGFVRIPVGEVASVLLGDEASRDMHGTVILDARLPKAIGTVLVGAALAVGGTQMQTMFRNPLADPFELGVSSGCRPGRRDRHRRLHRHDCVFQLGVLNQLGVTGAAINGPAL